MNSPRFVRTGLAVAALTVGAVAPTPANALVGAGQWAAPLSAFSDCTQIATTTVRCDHDASASGTLCRSQTVDLGRIEVTGTCDVFLTGRTAGAGRVVTDGFAPGCVTFGFDSGTLTFTDAVGATYSATISIANIAGVAHFSGSMLNGGGVTVGHTEGSFTNACGGLPGTFKGKFTLI